MPQTIKEKIIEILKRYDIHWHPLIQKGETPHNYERLENEGDIADEILEAMIEELPEEEKEKGYWAVPFVSPDSKIITHQDFYEKLQQNYDNSKTIGYNSYREELIKMLKGV